MNFVGFFWSIFSGPFSWEKIHPKIYGKFKSDLGASRPKSTLQGSGLETLGIAGHSRSNSRNCPHDPSGGKPQFQPKFSEHFFSFKIGGGPRAVDTSTIKALLLFRIAGSEASMVCIPFIPGLWRFPFPFSFPRKSSTRQPFFLEIL